MQKITKAEQAILTDLFSSYEKTVLKALKMLREKGGEYSIKPMLEVFFSNSSKSIRDTIYGVFCDLRDLTLSKSIEQNILSYKDSEHLALLLSAFWQSSLEFKNIKVFIEIFLLADDKTSFEVFTLIEQNAIYIDDSCRDECIMLLKSTHENSSDFKKIISSNLLEMFYMSSDSN